MSPTLLELAVAIVLVIVAYQLGVMIAPIVIRFFRDAKHDIDAAADEALSDPDDQAQQAEQRKEYTNGTHH